MSSSFNAFTGLRYFDVFNLRRSDVKGEHIEVATVKTSDSLIIELKAKPFKPEYVRPQNFYISVIDGTIRGEQPIGVSDYQLTKAIPDNHHSTFPGMEEVEEGLSKIAINIM